jgi:hypothetical protein
MFEADKTLAGKQEVQETGAIKEAGVEERARQQ